MDHCLNKSIFYDRLTLKSQQFRQDIFNSHKYLQKPTGKGERLIREDLLIA